MTDNNFTDEQIIKALECCGEDLCSCCPFYDDELGCDCNLQFLALDLIHRLKEENERITLEYAGFKAGVNHFADIGKMYSEVRAEAIREFAERLHKNARMFYEYYEAGWNCATLAVEIEDIKNLVKEMTEDKP